jgi:hypothetical protein
MTKNDRAALELAMEYARRDPMRAEQLDSKLAGTRFTSGKGWAIPPEPWEAVARFAAYGCQMKSLRLRPWETPPCHVDESRTSREASFLRKMLAAGVSRFHPDPLAALAEAEAAA